MATSDRAEQLAEEYRQERDEALDLATTMRIERDEARAALTRVAAITTNDLDGDSRIEAHEARGDRAWVVFYAGAQFALDRVRQVAAGAR